MRGLLERRLGLRCRRLLLLFLLFWGVGLAMFYERVFIAFFEDMVGGKRGLSYEGTKVQHCKDG